MKKFTKQNLRDYPFLLKTSNWIYYPNGRPDCAKTPKHKWVNKVDGCCYDSPPKKMV